MILVDNIFDTSDFEWKDNDLVLMIEVVDGVHSPSKDGLYLNTADLIGWIERDINACLEFDLETEAATLEEFLRRIRLLIANRGTTSG